MNISRRTSRKRFEAELMDRYDDGVEVARTLSDDPDVSGGGSPWLYLYYTPVGHHCGTWMRGEGWEFRANDER